LRDAGRSRNRHGKTNGATTSNAFPWAVRHSRGDAAMVAFLTSDDCSFSTGAVFDLSGGRATY
jgi:hypothetical protein